MRHFLTLSALLLAVCLAASSPIDGESRLENRLSLGVFGARLRRQSQQYVKGMASLTGHPLDVAIHKGEYRCGNKVCKLQPGEKPPCDVCQYPIH